MGLRTFLKKNFYNLKFIKNKEIKLKGVQILISGASSGIGLGICKKLVKENKIIAIYNNSKKNLDEIESQNLTSVKCDLSDLSDYKELNDLLQKREIDIFINCAGQFGSDKQSLENINFEYLIKIFKINSLAVLKILQLINLHNKLHHLKKIIIISSDGGSIKLNDEGGAYIYRITKSSLNSISKNLSVDLNKKHNSSVITVDPGNTKTNMNGKGYLSSEKCAEYLIDIISDKNNYNGKFINILKKEIPW